MHPHSNTIYHPCQEGLRGEAREAARATQAEAWKAARTAAREAEGEARLAELRAAEVRVAETVAESVAEAEKAAELNNLWPTDVRIHRIAAEFYRILTRNSHTLSVIRPTVFERIRSPLQEYEFLKQLDSPNQPRCSSWQLAFYGTSDDQLSTISDVGFASLDNGAYASEAGYFFENGIYVTHHLQTALKYAKRTLVVVAINKGKFMANYSGLLYPNTSRQGGHVVTLCSTYQIMPVFHLHVGAETQTIPLQLPSAAHELELCEFTTKLVKKLRSICPTNCGSLVCVAFGCGGTPALPCQFAATSRPRDWILNYSQTVGRPETAIASHVADSPPGDAWKNDLDSLVSAFSSGGAQ